MATAEAVVDESNTDEEETSSQTSTTLRHADIESVGRHHHAAATAMRGGEGWELVLQLAFQSIGVVYGDIGTSPLYVFASTFSDGIGHNDDIIGVLSLILYTLTLIPLVKYVLIVLRANDNGDGGTFALYSLICKHAKVGLIPREESEESCFPLEILMSNKHMQKPSKLQEKLEKSNSCKYVLLFATMVATSMVIGDGVLTPCTSVLSAVDGIKEASSHVTEDRIVWISVVILVGIFMVQRLGTDKVGYTFAPIISVWFALIAGVGVFNLIKYDPSVVKAINPKCIVDYFMRNKDRAWRSLSGVALAITGSEALFADVGHFSVRSIQMSMCSVTYPTLVLAYLGQASFLRKNNDSVSNAFYASIPGKMYWPMFVLAILASIIASQAMISATFSIIQQSLSLGCFPRVKIIHTSTKYPGQIYIPQVNYLLMFACVCVTLGFRTTAKISNAYGIAVMLVMTLTSFFLVLVMVIVWKTNILLVVLYVLIIGSVELVYLSSVLRKFDQGGYLPLVFATVVTMIMFVWNYVERKKYNFELENRVSVESVKEIIEERCSVRVPGMAIFYSELAHGIPPILKHYVANVPALHSVLVLVSLKPLSICRVPEEERFLFSRVQSKELQVCCCVMHYGYNDLQNEGISFEHSLIKRLKEFVEGVDHQDGEGDGGAMETKVGDSNMLRWRRVVHLVGEHEVVAKDGAGIWEKAIIEYGYNFLKNNLRQNNMVFANIPCERMLKIGMIYQL